MQGFERDQLAHPQAAGVHQLQHGAVAQAQIGGHIRRTQQSIHLRFAQGFGHTQRLFGGQHAQSGVGLDQAFAQRPPEKALEHREPAVG